MVMQIKMTDEYFEMDTPVTPRPFDNFLYTFDGMFRSAISQRGRGNMAYSQDMNIISSGRNFVIVDKDSGQCWSLNGGAAGGKPAQYRCRQYPGKSVFNSTNEGLSCELTLFLHPSEYAEFAKLEILNSKDTRKRFSLISYYEVELTGPFNQDGVARTFFDEASGAMLASSCHPFMMNYKYHAYFVSDVKPATYCGLWEDFTGGDLPADEYLPWKTGRLSNNHSYAPLVSPMVLALQQDIEISAKGSHRINFSIGPAEDIEDGKKLATKFVTNCTCEEKLAETVESFAKLCNMGKISTPDENINRIANVWTKVQLHQQVVSRRFGQWNNWRNNLQDAWGWMIYDHQPMRQCLIDMCRDAEADGFLPRTTPKFSGGKSCYQHHDDIATWTLWTAAEYAKETGDFKLFDEHVKYAGGQKSGTVCEVLVNAARWMFNHVGQNGMILLLEGDWSDPLEHAGHRGIGESPWTTVAMVHALNEFIPLLKKIGKNDIAEEFEIRRQALADAVNANAWDGNWYIRGITDDGVRFCTKNDPDARISLLMQAWAILADIVPADRLQKVVHAVDANCIINGCPILYGPPFMKVRMELGRESAKVPGTGENGSFYTHGAMMWTAAELKLGRADKALEIIKNTLPLRENYDPKIDMQSPLWWSNYFHAPSVMYPRRASGRYNSGGPAWFYQNLLQGLLGIKPEFDGLRIDTKNFPSCWPQARIVRNWRGNQYDISFEKTENAKKITVEGMELDDSIINSTILKNQKIPVIVKL